MMIKRFLAISVVITLICGIIPSAYAASEQTVSPEKVEFLTYMGFMTPDEDGDFGEKRIFTRGELAEVLCAVLGIAVTDVDEKVSVCADVTGSNEYAQYIKTICEAGYMELDANGRFWSTSPITIDDASEIFVKLQGGEILFNGLTPKAAAKRVGIIRDMDYSGNLTKGMVAELLYDTLHTGYYNQIIYGDEEVYKHEDSYLVLEALTGIVYGHGLVSGENGTTLTAADDRLENGNILINGVIYTDLKESGMLGYTVDYYYNASEKKSSIRKLVYIQKDRYKNEVTTIDADAICQVTNNYIEYYQDNDTTKTKKIKISGATNVIYNGVAYPAWSLADLTPNFGRLTFIENGYEGEDVLIVESIRFILVNYGSSNDFKIYDQISGDVLDLSDSSIKYEIRQRDGKELKFNRIIRPGKLLAVMESKEDSSKKYTIIMADEASVEGEITSIKDKKIGIDGKEIDMASHLYKEITDKDKANAGSQPPFLAIGKGVKAHIWNGVIVYLEASEAIKTRTNMAYLVALDYDNSGFNDKLRLKLVVEAGTFEIAEVAKNVVVDGVKKKNFGDVVTILANSAQLSKYNAQYPYAQPVQVWKNSNGLVNKIDTLVYNSTTETKEDSLAHIEEIITQSSISTPTWSAVYDTYNKSMYSSKRLLTVVSPKTRVFWVPTKDLDDGANFNVTANNSSLARGTTYTIEPFFFQKDSYISEVLLVYYTPSNSVGTNSQPCIITDMADVLNDEGEIVKQLDYVNISGGQNSVQIPAEVETGAVSVGDMIRMSTDYLGRVKAVDISFSPSASLTESERIAVYKNGDGSGHGILQTGYTRIYGTAVDRTESNILLTTSLKTDSGGVANYVNLDNFMVSSNTQFFKYEEVRGNPAVSVSSYDSIVPYTISQNDADELCLFVYGNTVRFVYVIEKN